MHRKLHFAIVAIACSACSSLPSQGTVAVDAADLQVVVGDAWKGTLTYRDYSPPHGDVTLQVEAEVKAVTGGLSISLHYPREPKADGTSEILLTEGGKVFDGEPVISREQTGDTLEIVTEGPCEDDGQRATCRHVYSLAPKQLEWRKFVRFVGGSEDVRRNAYTFVR